MNIKITESSSPNLDPFAKNWFALKNSNDHHVPSSIGVLSLDSRTSLHLTYISDFRA